MLSLKDSMKKPGTLISLEKSKEGRERGLEMPTNRHVGHRSLYLKAGRGSQASGQGMKVKALVARMEKEGRK